MFNSIQQTSELEAHLTGLLRLFPIADNPLEWERFGKAVAYNGQMIQAVAKQEINKRLKTLEIL